jgi:hypothetical protein
MKSKRKFRATFRDGSNQDLVARSLEHALGLIANQDLLLTLEELDERGTPIGGIYANFSDN